MIPSNKASDLAFVNGNRRVYITILYLQKQVVELFFDLFSLKKICIFHSLGLVATLLASIDSPET